MASQQPDKPRLAGATWVWLVVAGGFSVVVGVTAGAASGRTSIPLVAVLLILAGLLAVGSAVMALWRFEWFLLALFAIRPVLDGLSPEAQPRTLNASTAVGLVFIAASGLWLLDRHHRGEWTRPSPATAGLFLLVGAAALSCLVSVQPGTSAAGTLRLLSAVLMFAVLEQLLAGRADRLRQVLAAVLLTTALVMVWAAWQYVTGGGVDQYSGLLRLKGPFVHSNVLAKFLVVVLLLLAGLSTALRGRQRLAALVFGALVALVLVFTFARSAWGAAFLGVLYLLTRRDRRLVPLSIVVMIVLFSTVPALTARVTDLWAPAPIEGAPANSLSWRWGYWQDLLPLWRLSPVNGSGLDTVPSIGGQGLQAHNVWVQSLVEMGVVGLLGLLAVVVGFAITLRRRLLASVTLLEVAMSYTAIAVAAALLMMTVSENLLSETTTLWYAAAAMAYGFTPADARKRQDPSGAHSGSRSQRRRSRIPFHRGSSAFLRAR